jgi:Zn-finger nucleic acid-binding protein
MIRRNTRDEKAMRLFELHFAQQEIKDWVQFRRTRLDQDNRVKLRKTAQIQDRCLEDRLFAEGFRSENVMALEVYPVAKTAWARGIWLDRGELEKLIERSFQVDRQQQSEGFKRTEPQRHEDTYRQEDDRDYRRSEAPYYHHRKKRESWFSELFDFD